MDHQLKLGEISVDVQLKDIKNVHLSVYPPDGQVRISAPSHMKLDTIRVYAITRLGWIKKEQAKLRAQARETPREYVERESHRVWGKRYLLQVFEIEAAPSVELKHRVLTLRVRPGSTEQTRRHIIDAWYRQQIKDVVPKIIARWEPRLKVNVNRFFVQRMRTKWGSCNSHSRNIRINTDLAKQPKECLEYVVVHEMAHLIERHHNDRFVRLMDRQIPSWKIIRQTLNEAPLSQTVWPD